VFSLSGTPPAPEVTDEFFPSIHTKNQNTKNQEPNMGTRGGGIKTVVDGRPGSEQKKGRSVDALL